VTWLRRLVGSRPWKGRRDGDAIGAAGAAVPRAPTHDVDPAVDGPALVEDLPFACSTCGRTDLPEAGGWDPPICLECDAAINGDAIESVEITEDE
jgi:hypothetical protein